MSRSDVPEPPVAKPFRSLLIVDDDEALLFAASLFLKEHADCVVTETDPAAIPAAMEKETFDAIVLDMNFSRHATSGREGFEWLHRILEVDESAAVVPLTGYGDVEKAVQAMQEGASDFLLKPCPNEKLLATITAAVRLRRTRLEADHLRTQRNALSEAIDQPYQDLVGGRAPAMGRVLRMVGQAAGSEANVLMLGENGTGKDSLARALHRMSRRKDQVFVSVDLGAVPANLFEAVLFGHVKGAFTDARDSRPGRLEIASGGTLFLNEIGNLPEPLQAKLLSVLEDRQVFRVGAVRPVPIDVRIVCATNKPVQRLIHSGALREDLYYRINTIEVTVPPLRQRAEDIPALAEHFLLVFGRKYEKTDRSIGRAAMEKLVAYSWPGNVRQLQNAVERAVILSDRRELRPSDFALKTARDEDSGDNGDAGATPGDLNLDRAEKRLVQMAMTKNGGRVTDAARDLGVTRQALYRLLRKHGL